MKLPTLFRVLPFFLLLFIYYSSPAKEDSSMIYNPLIPQDERILLQKATEAPFTGLYNQHFQAGTYICKQCNAPLFYSDHKFPTSCGWPGFDDAIPGAVREQTDGDGHRTEILCANCKGHLGHVFRGEQLTNKNLRHCVNSLALHFIPHHLDHAPQRALFAAGCFWGVEFYFQKTTGVLDTQVGYTGGKLENPSYKDVCSKTTGHAEALEVYFDPQFISYESLVKLFFEIHDFTQINRQGPDIGEQYRSAIFYLDPHQKLIAQKISDQLTDHGYKVATLIEPAYPFYPAEEYHQNYYENKGTTPYCHIRKSLFK